MKIFITGGAGFIGSNVARFHLLSGDEVLVYDNLSREGVEKNLKWLKSLKENLKFIKGDIRDYLKLKKYLKKCDIVYHLAGQVAVTTSVIDPLSDFQINALGTLNVLEALRNYSPKAVFIYASTNKVYGNFSYSKFPKYGISEVQNLDFHSPYGCSKGAGDQYVRDYGRVYKLKTIVFRQSCIYGDRQFGTEDQGWVMHFVKSILENKTLTIFGNGKQVRDILHVEDLIGAYKKAAKLVKEGKPMVYNIGGGVANSISLIELVKKIEKITKKKSKIKYAKSREGDQQIYISDIRKVKNELNWKIKIDKNKGVVKLINWAKSI